MEPVSILAIYFLWFVAAAFISLPFGMKTDEEVGADLIPGQAESAPHRFDLKRHLIRAAIIALPLTGLWVANWEYGWIGAEAFDFYS